MSEGTWGMAMEAIINAMPSVDTFFVLSGLLVCYLTLKQLDRTKGITGHVQLIALYYIHRYIRYDVGGCGRGWDEVNFSFYGYFLG